MACSPTPTATQFETTVSLSSSTTFTQSVSSLPPLVTTITTFSCSPTTDLEGETGCIGVGVPVVTTINVGEVTFQVPIFTILSVTQTIPTSTLFAPCSIHATDDPPQPSAQSYVLSAPSSSISSSAKPPHLSLSGNPYAAPNVAKPATAFSTRTETSVIQNSVTTQTVTLFASDPQPASYQQTASSETPIAKEQNEASASPTNVVGPIVGGVLGGFLGLIGIVVAIWCCWSNRYRMISASRSPTPVLDAPQPHYRKRRLQVDTEAEPKPQPYQYGAVGSATSKSASQPGTPRQSSMYSHSPSPSSPQSISPRMSMGGMPTPTFMPSTALQPGPSQPSTRPSTPGYFNTVPPSAFHMNPRQSWPAFGSVSDESHEGDTSQGSPIMSRSRRPSRLSTAFASWDSTLEGRPLSSRTVSMSRSVREAARQSPIMMRRPSAAEEPEPISVPELDGEGDGIERRKSALYVVNADPAAPQGSAEALS